jgi:hypothetical protein
MAVTATAMAAWGWRESHLAATLKCTHIPTIGQQFYVAGLHFAEALLLLPPPRLRDSQSHSQSGSRC